MSNVYLTGDIHSQTPSFKTRLNQSGFNFQENDSLICLGDVGLEYGEMIYGGLRKEMKKFPGTVYIMRGNHDARYWRNHTEISKTMTSHIVQTPLRWQIENNLLFDKKYDNIKYICDEGGIYNINGNNILFIPGAYSVDKQYRLNNGYPYEWEEQLTWIEQNNILSLCEHKKIDYVCSHTAPLCTQPYYKDLFLNFLDQSTIDNGMERFLDEVYRLIGKDVKRWYFGHFHDDRNVSTNFTMLYTKVVKLGEKIEG